MDFKQKYLAGAACVCSVVRYGSSIYLQFGPGWKVPVCIGNGCISSCIRFAGIAKSSAFV